MIKLIATDMDGTWLREDKTYDKELFEKEFQIMQDRDIKFVIASGNQYENILDRFPKANKHMYFVAENGALIAHGNEILQISDNNCNRLPMKNHPLLIAKILILHFLFPLCLNLLHWENLSSQLNIYSFCAHQQIQAYYNHLFLQNIVLSSYSFLQF